MFLMEVNASQQMYDKATLKNGGTLESVPDWYMTQ